jgi:hypothetical protein
MTVSEQCLYIHIAIITLTVVLRQKYLKIFSSLQRTLGYVEDEKLDLIELERPTQHHHWIVSTENGSDFQKYCTIHIMVR